MSFLGARSFSGFIHRLKYFRQSSKSSHLNTEKQIYCIYTIKDAISLLLTDLTNNRAKTKITPKIINIPFSHKETLENPEQAQKSPDQILRYLRYSTDLTISCLFDIESEKQKLQSSEKRLSTDSKSSSSEIEKLRNKLEEKDNELKEIARRMQSWKLSTAKSLAAKLERKIGEELSIGVWGS